MADPRTYLFVPGNRPERFAKALVSGADAVVLDLEDAVAAKTKDEARAVVADWLVHADPADRARTSVRINATGAPEHTADLTALAASGPSTVMLPKAETPEQVAAVRAALGPVAVLALVETARGVEQAAAVAVADGVTRLVFGTLDLALDLDLEIDESPDGLGYAAGRLAVASRLAGLPGPVAGVTPQLDDPARLLTDLAWSRRHGFAAKLCIHPAQVEPIHTALAPDAAALAWAHRVLAAERATPGAARLDGRMVDRPVVRRAHRTLARAGR